MNVPQKKSQKKIFLIVMIGIGIFLIGVTLFVLREDIREQYWLWVLENGDGKSKEEVLTSISAQGRASIVPHLFKKAAQSFNYGNWMVDGPMGRARSGEANFIFKVLSEKAGYEIDVPLVIQTMKNIRKREPERVSPILTPYLKSSHEHEKYIAALVLFDQLGELRPYIPSSRIHSSYLPVY